MGLHNHNFLSNWGYKAPSLRLGYSCTSLELIKLAGSTVYGTF
jgi:hypothetical protein